MQPDAFGNALGGSVADAMEPKNTAQQNFRQSEIKEQNAQARSDALYGLVGPSSGASDTGLRLVAVWA